MNRVAAVLAASAFLVACAPASGGGPVDAPLSVSTSSGDLRGSADEDTRTFLGVRFAEAPTGDRRWAAPVPARRASGPVDATEPGARCPQTGAEGTSEDCLFLNVTTPRRVDPGAKLPVMVWWHGGGFTSGAGDQYDARRLAARGDVIVVTANKRLGIFGYLGAPGLAGSGDFGFADQLQATRWAKKNAAAFGGDPGNITVFGQSDGGMAACAALTSPAAEGLVDKVATMSGGSCQLSWPTGGLLPGTPAQTPYTSVADNQAVSKVAADALGCTEPDPVPCLRSQSTDKLLPQSINFSNTLTYGTDLLPENPATAVRAGRVLDVPVLTGGTEHEERSFVAGAEQAVPGTFSPGTLPTLLASAFGPKAQAVAAQYPLTAYASAGEAFATTIDDASWSCPLTAGNDALAKKTTVYAYEFADPSAPNVNGVQAPGIPLGPTHAADLPYLFDLGGKNLTAGNPLADTMVDLWSSFAHTGTPQAPGVTWPQYHAATDTLQLTETPRTVDAASEHRCAFWSG